MVEPILIHSILHFDADAEIPLRSANRSLLQNSFDPHNCLHDIFSASIASGEIRCERCLAPNFCGRESTSIENVLSKTHRRTMIAQRATQIAARIAAGETTAAEVADAYIAELQAVNPPINAVIGTRFDRARREAEEIDRLRANGIPLGPLAGVPITVKDCFEVQGMASTLGVHARREHRADRDGVLVAALKAAGAIVLGKTNVSQLMFFHESDNPLFGRTNHPTRPDRSPGGSSGGEAAIVAAGGSVLGLGSDLGGSIRQPAHSCGIHGIKPTAGRLTNIGCVSTLSGMDAVKLQAGPLARSVDDLTLALQVLTTASNQPLVDHRIAPANANGGGGTKEISQLTIGFYADDGYFTASPAIVRATGEAAAALRAAGATVVPFAPPNMADCMAIYSGLLGADGGQRFRRMLGSSPRDWRIKRLLRLAGLRFPMRPLVAATLAALDQQRRATLLRNTGPLSANGYWQVVGRLEAYVQNFMSLWREQQLDAIVCPPFGVPALAHGTSLELIPAASYSILANVLGIPAGTLAATRVRAGEEFASRGKTDPTDLAARQAESSSAGLPVGVQVMAAHWREDLVLAVMKFLEAHFARSADYPPAQIGSE